ncbi:MAG: DUF5615 family PIN-like protein [Candidatus Limnocylindria bacterium]
MARLTKAGHQLVPTLRGAPDREAWLHAQEREAVVLTANVRDFVALAGEAEHHGLLVVYREEDTSKNLRAADIARAISNVASAFEDTLTGQVLALNHYR